MSVPSFPEKVIDMQQSSLLANFGPPFGCGKARLPPRVLRNPTLWPALIDIGTKLAAVVSAGGAAAKVALALAVGACIQFTPRLRRSQIEIPEGLKYIYQAHKADVL